jgi:hypothetical protein
MASPEAPFGDCLTANTHAEAGHYRACACPTDPITYQEFLRCLHYANHRTRMAPSPLDITWVPAVIVLIKKYIASIKVSLGAVRLIFEHGVPGSRKAVNEAG